MIGERHAQKPDRVLHDAAIDPISRFFVDVLIDILNLRSDAAQNGVLVQRKDRELVVWTHGREYGATLSFGSCHGDERVHEDAAVPMQFAVIALLGVREGKNRTDLQLPADQQRAVRNVDITKSVFRLAARRTLPGMSARRWRARR
jgi:hypothetical protein